MPLRIRCPASRSVVPSLPRSQGLSRSTVLSRSAPLGGRPNPRQYATVASSLPAMSALRLPDDYVPPTQPPSARRPETRNSQLLRTYTSLLRSTPLLLLFQHNNLTANEWVALRRELKLALESVAAPSVASAAESAADDIVPNIKLQVITTRIFDVALRVVEYFDPSSVPTAGPKPKTYNHDLSKAAHAAMKAAMSDPLVRDDPSSTYAQLSPLLTGPMAVLTIPAVSPAHLAAALRVLSPSAPMFPPPSRKTSPGYYDPMTQSALQKLLLVGGRVEGRIFDTDGVRWVGSIEGGMDGLRAQLVAMLQNAGLGLTSALESAGKNLWLTMESRRSVLEEAEKGDSAGEPNE